MPDERFMRHHYGASGYVEPTEGALTPRGEKIARVQQMCTEGFCNISITDKEAIREVLHSMYDAVAANTAEFEGHKLTIADHRKEMERLTDALKFAISEKRKEQEENTKLREIIQELRGRMPQ